MVAPRSTNHFPAIAAGLRPKARQLVGVAIVNIHQRVVQSMSDRDPPSAPGSPPAVRTGYLRASYAHKMIEDVVGAVYATADYAPHLELGTIFMAARPALKPAVDAERRGFMAALKLLFRP